MPNLARLYLDTARLGLMSPSSQLAAQDFARLAGEGVSTLYFQQLLRGPLPEAKELPALPGLADWQGVEGLKARLRRMLGLPTSAPVLFASRTASLLRWAARQLWKQCSRVLIPDTAWPPYVRILEDERLRCRGEIVRCPIRDLVQFGQADASHVIAKLTQAYIVERCDGLFMPAISHDGVRVPAAPLLSVLRRKSYVRLAVIDGAQELAHVPVNLAATGCDVWLAGAHKWLGGHQPLGIACLANPNSSAQLFHAAVADYQTPVGDDSLQRFLLRLEGRPVQDIPETINLAPLFSTWGALRDMPAEQDAQAGRLQVRRKNAALVRHLLARSCWEVHQVCPSLTTGILLLRASDWAIRQLPAEILEMNLENVGVALTALGGGVLRLSLPAIALDDQQQSHLLQALLGNGRDRSSAAAECSSQHPCLEQPAPI